MLFTKNLYTAIKLVHFWPFWTLFPYYLQFIFMLHQIQYYTSLTTIHYSSAQQISGCYNLRVQCYSQRIYIQLSNWFIFDHFGHYFQIIFNLYSYCTKFNSIHINYNILSNLSTNFSMLSLTSAMLFTKNLYTAIKLVHLWPFWTIFPGYFQLIFILHKIQFDTH